MLCTSKTLKRSERIWEANSPYYFSSQTFEYFRLHILKLTSDNLAENNFWGILRSGKPRQRVLKNIIKFSDLNLIMVSSFLSQPNIFSLKSKNEMLFLKFIALENKRFIELDCIRLTVVIKRAVAKCT